jgi:hypothetical protein
MRKIGFLVIALCILWGGQGMAQNDTAKAATEAKPKKWYESIALRGYVQVRNNNVYRTNPDLKCEQCDRSWGTSEGFFVRRARLIFSGNVSENVYFYIQPDLASSVSPSSLHFAQLRDAYFDISLDRKKEFRFRIGQSKIPFGFENLQSSQNRLPLDRNDALNSAVANERDLGVFFYWAPAKTRKLFTSLVNDGYKGSGDYGVVGIGAYNGQTANKPDQNSDPHYVARVSYPFEIGNQIIEPGIQGYTGKYVVTSDQRNAKTTGSSNFSYLDERMAATFVLYPKPFGIQAEYNIGKGPEFNTGTDAIELRELQGGYVTASYMIKLKKQVLIPFSRATYYQGGKKHEMDARSYKVNEYELGVEWQLNRNFEFVAMFVNSYRRFEDYAKQKNVQKGETLRLQAQLNF